MRGGVRSDGWFTVVVVVVVCLLLFLDGFCHQLGRGSWRTGAEGVHGERDKWREGERGESMGMRVAKKKMERYRKKNYCEREVEVGERKEGVSRLHINRYDKLHAQAHAHARTHMYRAYFPQLPSLSIPVQVHVQVCVCVCARARAGGCIGQQHPLPPVQPTPTRQSLFTTLQSYE